jgi:hypothetical protein
VKRRWVFGVLLLTSGIILLAAQYSAHARLEAYSSRPDILNLTPKAHPELGADWVKLRRAHIEAAAQLLEMNPDREIYLLGRDLELLHDLMRYLTRNDPNARARIHLINVSGGNKTSPHLKEYLAQEGISEAALKSGKKFLFADVGFSGSIPLAIKAHFPPEFHAQLETQLLCAASAENPSSRVFLTAMNPAATTLSPASMQGALKKYEALPRFTDRSSRIEWVNGRWEPLSETENVIASEVDKAKAVAYMEDLLAHARDPQAIAHFQQRAALYRKLHALSALPGVTLEKEQAELKALLAAHPRDPLIEAMVRDYIEARERQTGSSRVSITVEAVGLPPIAPGGMSNQSNKKALLERYPEWISILGDPKGGISKAIESGDFKTLGEITDFIYDPDFSVQLASELGRHAATAGVSSFVRKRIEAGGTENLGILAQHYFSNPNSANSTELLDLLIDTHDPSVYQKLAKHLFSQPHSRDLGVQLKAIIERADPETLSYLARFTFTQPHTADKLNLLERLIERADGKALETLAQSTFKSRHLLANKELLRQVARRTIEVGHESAQYQLAINGFGRGTHAVEYAAFTGAIQLRTPQELAKRIPIKPMTRDERLRFFDLHWAAPHCMDRVVHVVTPH